MDSTTGSRSLSRRDCLAAGGAAAFGLLGLGRGSAAFAQGRTPEQLIREAGQLAAAAENDEDWRNVWAVIDRLNRVEGPDPMIIKKGYYDRFRQTGQRVEQLGAICALFRNFPSTHNIEFSPFWTITELTASLADVGNVGQARIALGVAQQTTTAYDGAEWVKQRLSELRSRVAIRTYAMEWDLGPEVNPDAARAWLGYLGDYVAAIPLDRPPYQSCTEWGVVGAKSHRLVEREWGGNPCVRITPDGAKTATFEAKVRLVPDGFRSRLEDFTDADIPTDVRPFLRAWPTVDYNQPHVQSVIADEGLRGGTRLESIENVMRYCDEKLKSHQETLPLEGRLENVLKYGSAYCETFATAAVGLMRALGVPARLVRGNSGICFNEVGATNSTPTWHTWPEFYVPSFGWLQWDGHNPPFVCPVDDCVVVGLYTYTRPMAGLSGQGENVAEGETLDLWNFQGWYKPGDDHMRVTWTESEP
jgi:hypothetical protein